MALFKDYLIKTNSNYLTIILTKEINEIFIYELTIPKEGKKKLSIHKHTNRFGLSNHAKKELLRFHIRRTFIFCLLE